MFAVAPVPAGMFENGDLLDDVTPEDLVYFLVNVGDGDTQLVLLPTAKGEGRQAIVIDVLRAAKLEGLLGDLEQTVLFDRPPAAGRRETFPLVVATHPHADHIGGMPRFLDRFRAVIGEFWEPGYFHTIQSYHDMMRALEDHKVRLTQPTSGTTRFIGETKVTVLTPGIGLRNRFDSYGVNINNASLSLKLEFPASRVEQRDKERLLRRPVTRSLILGADAQTLAWAQAAVDFPQLGPDRTLVAKVMDKAQGASPLKADVFKVPHHGSKHGLNLELVEEMAPQLSLVSSVWGRGKYNFPHSVTVEALREALQPIASDPDKKRRADHEIGIHYTGATDSAGKALGTIGLVMGPKGKRRLWRFGDTREQAVDLSAGRRFTGP